MNLDKLKEAARKYEQREDWRRAIEVYLQAIREAEASGGGEPIQDPGLYNRVGDLQLKAGDFMAALRAYEEAAELYTDQGFFNNAIALCGKILRIDSNRTPAYLRLAQLHARKNFAGEARRNLSDYLQRMQGTAQREEALRALRSFADRFASNPETRAMMVELLRSAPGFEDDPEFGDLAAYLEAGHDGSAFRSEAKPPTKGEHGSGPEHLGRGVAFHNDLIFLDTGFSMSPEGLEAESDDAAPGDRLVGRTGSESLVPERADASRDDHPHSAAALDPAVAARESASYHQDVPEGPEFQAEQNQGERRESGIITADSASPRRADGRPATAPGSTETVASLEATLRDLETESRWLEALDVAARLIQLEPEAVPRYQKRVELAYFSGNREVLIESYLNLAGALARLGNPSQAALVYRRVLAHESDNEAARQGLAAISTASHAPAPSPRFVDLGALILEDPATTRDVRIRVEEKEVDEDEDRVFRETLADFKRGVEARLEPDDFEAHYDLGIAFKEMGLTDEAISQFQKALRAHGGPRLKAAEQLGIAFYEQGQYGIAEVVLRRATNGNDGEEEKLGVLYWLGRVLESQGKKAEALPLYEQAAALDIRFLDVRERVRRMGEPS
jgi:tetratricopeptide (TPR) repeat protein